VDLDDPAEAARFLEGVEDASLLKYVPAAAKPLETVPEFACLELGEWYRSLADAAPPAAKPLMFARAKAYCERFLQLHTAEDLDRAKAALLLQKIAGEMQAAGTPKPVVTKQGLTPATKTKKEEWIDLLPVVDLSKDALGGGWEKNGAELVIKSEVPRTRVAIPVLVDGAYELEVRCTRIFGQQTYGVVLPVGSRQAFLRLSQVSRESDLCGLDGTKIPTPIRSGDETVVLARVTLTGDQAEIDVKLNGNPLIHWKGPVSSLPSPEWWAIPNAKCPALVSSSVKSAWHSVRLRMVSGEATLLRPGEKSSVPITLPGKAPSGKPLPAASARALPPGQPIDLLALVDPQRDAVLGDWSREADGLVMRGPGGSRLAIPCAVEGDYELKVEFARMKGDNEVAFILPVGSRCSALLISKEVGKRSGLFWAAKGDTMVSPAPLANREPHALEVMVKTGGGTADIDVRLDGKPYFHWQGAVSSASLWDAYKLPAGNRLGFGAWGGEIVFKTARLRMLSGEAKVLTPAGTRPGG
jgi:hypothetical protein